MFSRSYFRFALVATIVLGAVPALVSVAAVQTAPKNEYFKGNVVPLADVLDKQGVKLDADAAGQWMALVTEAGKIYPLVKDDGSRRFFMDKGLLNRPMRLTARQVPHSQLLQVIDVHSYVDGKLHEVFYWCDICTIRDNEPGICHCCGAPFEFREVPVK